MKNVNDLIDLLNLEQIASNTFKGISKTIGSPNVFGGQVLAQALNAANRTVPEERILHSLHSYFLEAGKLEVPIIFIVEEMRDGGSFSTRRVKAMQNDVIIFILAASFHKIEAGFEHQKAIKKNIKQPEELISWNEIVDQFGDFIPKNMRAFLSIERPIDFKPTVIPNPLDPQDLPAQDNIWFKLKGDSV